MTSSGSTKTPAIGTPTTGESGESGEGIVAAVGNCDGDGSGMTDLKPEPPGKPTPKAKTDNEKLRVGVAREMRSY